MLGSAQSSIKMEMHTFDNLGLLDVVTQTIGRGVSVTILLEGGPVGGIDDQENVGVPADRSGGRAVLVHDQRYVEREYHPRSL